MKLNIDNHDEMKATVEKALAVLGIDSPGYSPMMRCWRSMNPESKHHGYSPLTVDTLLDLALERNLKFCIGTEPNEDRQPDEGAYIFGAIVGFNVPGENAPMILVASASDKLVACLGALVSYADVIASLKEDKP